jgi:tetratricopeptide (TPR) repeat protein
MNRVETAISDGRCVLAVGGRALSSPEVLAELRRRRLPVVALGGEAVNPAVAVSAAALAPALDHAGGLLVLIEPEAAVDGKALAELERCIKDAKHKPRLVIAAKAFNPFGLPMSMRLLKFDQEKARAVDFLSSLSVQEAPAPAEAAPAEVRPAAAPVAPAKPGKTRAPRPTFVGREEELAALGAMLSEDGGAIVVHGPSGVGRRWLIDKALGATSLKRLPDFTFSRGCGIDAFAARVALVAREAGDTALHDALSAEGPGLTPVELADLIVAALEGPGLAGSAWVLGPLDALLDRRDGSFYRNGRLELVLRRVLVRRPALRMVFWSDLAPTFYREGDAAALRLLPLGGLKGRELHELFAAWHAPEFPRDRFGQIQERVHGHPLGARAMALRLRDDAELAVDALLEQPKAHKAESAADLSPVTRSLKKRLGGLPTEQVAALQALAMPEIALDAKDLTVMQISRDVRLALLSSGLLEQSPTEPTTYRVHELVAVLLDRREVEDFTRMEAFGQHLHGRAKELKSEGDLHRSLAYALEGNRLLVEARRGRARMRLPYPDLDADLDGLRGLVRRRGGRLDIARARINELKKHAARNPELLLLDAELLVGENAPVDAIQAAYDLVAAEAPTPEVFHTEASWHQGRNARGKAVGALERGVAAFPEDARLRRRLAGFQLSAGKLADAVETLRAAQDLEPMMPDTYGMLGEIYTQLGVDHWAQAEQCIEEAGRLAPQNPMHTARRAGLLRQRALLAEDGGAELFEAAEKLLQEALTAESDNHRIQVLLATVLLDRGGDVERARWLLKQAGKRRDGSKRKDEPGVMVQRVRVLLREGNLDEAERMIGKTIKLDGSNHAAFAVKAEVLMARGHALLAFEAMKTARERSPKHAPERPLYERQMAAFAAVLAAQPPLPPLPDSALDDDPTPVSGGGTTREGATILRKSGAGGASAGADLSAPEGEPDAGDPAQEEPAVDEDDGRIGGGFDDDDEPAPADGTAAPADEDEG